MPGIAVVAARRPEPEALGRALAALRHRAPVATGLFGDRTKGPPRIAFSGRLFNRPELIGGFGGAIPASLSDGDLVLRLYERDGDACVEALDGTFAFVVDDPERGLFAARDALGCQPLYVGERGGTTWFVSEMKAFPADLEDFRPLPPSATFRPDDAGRPFAPFRSRISREDGETSVPLGGTAFDRLEDLLDAAVKRRLRGRTRVGILLSGGLDSSIIAALAARHLPCVDTFAVGTADGEDLAYARLCAEHLETRHRELVYDRDTMLAVLPDVIRTLESFDAPLVRSAVPNYLAARLAQGAADLVLSGEGADELYAGYPYMLEMRPADRDAEIRDVLGTLHATGLQRGDRCASAFGLEVHAPFLDAAFVRFSLAMPVADKTGPGGEEKWPLRQAFADLLPDGIVRRPKRKFSVGVGSSNLLAEWAEATIPDAEFEAEAVTAGGRRLSGKEELLYYRLFRRHFPQVCAEQSIGFTRGA